MSENTEVTSRGAREYQFIVENLSEKIKVTSRREREYQFIVENLSEKTKVTFLWKENQFIRENESNI